MLENFKIEPNRIYTALFMLVAVILIIIFHTPFLMWSVFGIAFLIGTRPFSSNKLSFLLGPANTLFMPLPKLVNIDLNDIINN